MELRRQSRWGTAFGAQLAPAQPGTIIAADLRKGGKARLHGSPVQMRRGNSRFENDGRRSRSELKKMQLVTADLD